MKSYVPEIKYVYFLNTSKDVKQSDEIDIANSFSYYINILIIFKMYTLENVLLRVMSMLIERRFKIVLIFFIR